MKTRHNSQENTTQLTFEQNLPYINLSKTISYFFYNLYYQGDILSNGHEGEVLRICDGVIDYGRKNIEVMWSNEVKSLHKTDDLKLKKGVKCAYYPDHLPILGKGNYS